MRLYVAEKKDVADAIVAALGNEANLEKGYYEAPGKYRVTWAWGHLMALKDPEDFNKELKKWTLDSLPLSWPVDLKPIKKTEHQLHVIWRLMGECNEVVNCADPDCAGQKIFQDILSTSPRKPKKVLRALFNDNNTAAIQKAISNVRDNADFYGMYLEDLARSVGDQKLGYNLTRLLTTQASKQGLNILFTVGRVQSAVLGLVVNRERNKKAHTTSFYYNISADLKTAAGSLKAKLTPSEELSFELDHEDRFSNQQEMVALAHSLNEGTATLSNIVRKKAKDSPPLPHDLLSLQVEASRIFGLRPDQTLDITQSLRDKKAITYNRSDTRYLTDENHQQAGYILANLAALDQYKWINAMGADPKVKSRAFNTSKTTAHHALMPTGNVSEYSNFSQDEVRIFALVARNFIVQFLPKRERVVTTFDAVFEDLAGKKYKFVGKTSRTTLPGWETVFAKDKQADGMEKDTDDDDTEIDTSNLFDGERIQEFKVDCTKQQTKPAPSYTMETLLKDLQHTAKYLPDEKYKQYLIDKDKDNDDSGGIGTAATRADILAKLFDNSFLEYTADKKPKIVPTERGYALYDLLPSRITTPELTAIWAHEFTRIQSGELKVEQFWNELDDFIANEVHRIKTEGLTLPNYFVKAETGENGYKDSCPKCKAILPEKKGKYGPYYRCEPCESFYKSVRHKLMYAKCEKCGSDMKVLSGKKKGTYFFGCSNYPKCKNTQKA
ncbi:DNA topoisomerase [Vibrio owensii]|uniref:DNA topoisomerase n=1 Tax=Vibrio owensii TaxID=696485 RepID=UPI0018F1ED7B|nr:DNA topoisomerase [Vibrio owensii]